MAGKRAQVTRPICNEINLCTEDSIKILTSFVAKHPKNKFTHNEIIELITRIDRYLLRCGWQFEPFICSTSSVFLYMLLKDTFENQPDSSVAMSLCACMFVAYSYIGHEISYPMRPFAYKTNPAEFMKLSLKIVENNSRNMLKINISEEFYDTMLNEFRSSSVALQNK